MSTRAFRTLDCARKVRVRYYLPRVVDAEFLGGLPASELEVQEFSKLVEGARDHFQVRGTEGWSASGVLGERTLVVTFGKFGQLDTAVEATIRELQAALEALGCGEIEEQNTPGPDQALDDKRRAG